MEVTAGGRRYEYPVKWFPREESSAENGASIITLVNTTEPKNCSSSYTRTDFPFNAQKYDFDTVFIQMTELYPDPLFVSRRRSYSTMLLSVPV